MSNSMASHMLDEMRACRSRMLAYMQEEHRVHGRMPGMASYRLMHAFVETLEAYHDRNLPVAHTSTAKWQAIANQMLDAQLFGDTSTVAISISAPGHAVHGTDGCTFHLGEMIKQQKEEAARAEAGIEVA